MRQRIFNSRKSRIRFYFDLASNYRWLRSIINKENGSGVICINDIGQFHNIYDKCNHVVILPVCTI